MALQRTVSFVLPYKNASTLLLLLLLSSLSSSSSSWSIFREQFASLQITFFFHGFLYEVPQSHSFRRTTLGGTPLDE